MHITRYVWIYTPSLVFLAGCSKSTYEACCELIYHLAKDKVLGENETDLYLIQKINPFIDPAIVNMARDVNAAVSRLDYALRRSTVELATELAALSHENKQPYPAIDLDQMRYPDIQQALRNFGFDAAGVSVSITFDALAISQSRIAAILTKESGFHCFENFWKAGCNGFGIGDRCIGRRSSSCWGHPGRHRHSMNRIRYL